MKCLDCGNTKNFIAYYTNRVMEIFDTNGNLVEDFSIDSERSASTECAECHSENLE